MQRPEHHQDLRDHGARPRLRDPRDARRGRLEARRQLAGPRVALKPALALLVVATAVLTAGCGAVDRVTNGDAAHGKELFAKAPGDGKPSCASCHTLKDAGSTSKVGPNLDDAFESARKQGFDESTIRDVIRGQIAYAEEPMPQNLYEGQDARDVAFYVGKCAGVADCGVRAAGESAQPPPPSGGGGKVDGKEVFASNCGGCHTLEDAGTSGTVGPNLDQSKPSKARAKTQVENGGGAMPPFKGQLSDAQIEAVAEYVSSAAGK